jgi:hypothetical protein
MRSRAQRLEAFKEKFTSDEKAIGGIPAGIINIVTVMIILTMVPMIIIPMESASSTALATYGSDKWNTSYNNTVDNNRNAFGTLSGITNIQATILILAVVLAIAM